MKFSSREVRDLVFSGILISLAFGILLSGGYRALSSNLNVFFISFLIAFFTAGIGFLLHELMHKAVAQRYGLFAEFKAFYPMLLLAVVFSFFGFIFAAPGAVFLHGMITRERSGKISVAGPLTNIVLAAVFLLLSLITQAEGILGAFFSYGLSINALLAAFNMIPVMPFDGAKVVAWSKGAYGITLALAVGLLIVSWILY